MKRCTNRSCTDLEKFGFPPEFLDSVEVCSACRAPLEYVEEGEAACHSRSKIRTLPIKSSVSYWFLAISFIVYVASEIYRPLTFQLALVPDMLSKGAVWQVATYVIHPGNIVNLFVTTGILAVAEKALRQKLGIQTFLRLCAALSLGCGIIYGALIFERALLMSGGLPTLSLCGGIFAGYQQWGKSYSKSLRFFSAASLPYMGYAAVFGSGIHTYIALLLAIPAYLFVRQRGRMQAGV